MKIPDNVTKIEERQFSGCKNLSALELPRNLKSIDEFAFNECVSLKKVDLPVNLLSVDGFSGCTGLRTMIIPNHVTTLGNFSNCVNLEAIKIPPSVKNITVPFTNCPELMNITWEHLSENIAKFPAYHKTVVEKRKAENKCTHCGGDFKLISKTCKVCGLKKDY